MARQAIETGGRILELQSITLARKVLELMKAKNSFQSMETEDVNFLKGLPTMLMQNGLGQTLAFLAMKKDEKVLPVLVELVFSHTEVPNPSDPKVVMEYVTGDKLDATHYIKKQQEAMQCAAWMKRFAVAFHDHGKKGG